MFSKALLEATYVGGSPPRLTPEHKKAEHHRFKTQLMFPKGKPIAKEAYVSRLIQQLLIIKMLETHLSRLSVVERAPINAFFQFSYCEHLWRTTAMEADLRDLGAQVDKLSKAAISKRTNQYLDQIKTLKPKELLAHFLLHVSGFMHGGNIIQHRFIKPSNRLTKYQIPARQYDFSATKRENPLEVYSDMMEQVDNGITLDDSEYQEIVKQCRGIYETMSGIYDDLCDMHVQQPKITISLMAVLAVSLVVIACILKLLGDQLYPMSDRSLAGPGS